MYSKFNSRTSQFDFMENEFIFSIDSSRQRLIDLNEERILSEEINLVEREINALQFKKSFLTENLCVKHFDKPHGLRQFIGVSNSNKVHFEKSCKNLSQLDKNIELLYKEYTFLSNLTKLRFVLEKSGETQLINNSPEVICYFLKKDNKKYKISIAEFDLREDRLKTAEIFWRHMSVLYVSEEELKNSNY